MIVGTCAICLAVTLRYPIRYRSIVEREAKLNGLSTEFVMAVINSESSFRVDAVSNKGAIGLMQIMPSTAQFCCYRMNIPYDESNLKSVEYNLKIGCYYLGYLSKRFQSEENVICAYNAGEGTVRKWIEEKRSDIPYYETRKYLQRVKRAKTVYKYLLKK